MPAHPLVAGTESDAGAGFNCRLADGRLYQTASVLDVLELVTARREIMAFSDFPFLPETLMLSLKLHCHQSKPDCVLKFSSDSCFCYLHVPPR